jgi:hypothetical protein
MPKKCPIPGYKSLAEFAKAHNTTAKAVQVSLWRKSCYWPRRNHADKKKHPLYETYNQIRARCYSKKCKHYKWYGARGIRMNSRWYADFWAFVNDIGEKPGPEYSLDRIDNNGNYEPGNCRWATQKQQILNTRKVLNAKHVYKIPSGYRAVITGKHIGVFKTELEALVAIENARSVYRHSVLV